MYSVLCGDHYLFCMYHVYSSYDASWKVFCYEQTAMI